MRVRVPLLWRLIILAFLSVLLVVTSTTMFRRVGAMGAECLGVSLQRIDITTDKVFYPRPRVSSNVNYHFPETGTVFGVQPASTWAVHGNRYAYLEYGGSWGTVPTRLIIASPAEGLHREFLTTSTITNGSVLSYVWSGNGDGTHAPIQYLIWSPDGNYILYAYYDDRSGSYQPGESARWTYSLFGVDGTVLEHFTSIPHRPDTLTQWRAVWAADSRSVIFPQYGTKPLVLDIPYRRLSVVGNSKRNSSQWIAAQQRVNGKTSITITNLNGDQSTRLIDGADDAGDPSWSPDGSTIAVVWATGQAQHRKVYLTVSRVDSAATFTLDDGFWDIRDLLWLNDGGSLLYIAHRKDGAAVEMVDLATGITRRLGAPYTEVARVEQNPDNNRLSFWWLRGGRPHTIGIATYNIDGTLIYNRSLHYPIDGFEVFRTPYKWMKWQEVLRSPDGSIYAIHHNFFFQEPRFSTLELIAADGSWSRIISDLPYSSSEPLWSPDSQLLAFAESDGASYNPWTVKIITARGDFVKEVKSLRSIAGVFWTPCG